MAGDWIKMRIDLKANPKVVRIASALKADRLRTIGGLYSAWCLFDAYSIDGTMEGYTSDILDEEIGFPGFANAMKSVGWLDENAQGLVMPRFDAHNGQSAKRRAQDADRKKVSRMSASEADELRTREEKRREEKDIPPNPQGDEGGRKVKIDETPYQEILEAFRLHLPNMPQPEDAKAWNKTRKAAVKARYDENEKRQNPAWWQKYFGHVAKSAFLTGKTPENFEATFDWLMKPTNMQKVIEGNYHKVINHA